MPRNDVLSGVAPAPTREANCLAYNAWVREAGTRQAQGIAHLVNTDAWVPTGHA
ncbi:hypothetical protein [Pseudogemmobacter bohemicus]|uniref:hypothetical protein n=1 Tax=Pseudogemmobacter bohemicus TaxID=2250708 RepID=UPI0013003619|nr:hypothetical protein [Pseudogemmobacter bohemicus]